MDLISSASRKKIKKNNNLYKLKSLDRPGRPKIYKPLKKITFTLQEIFDKPEKFQNFDQFSLIPKLILDYVNREKGSNRFNNCFSDKSNENQKERKVNFRQMKDKNNKIPLKFFHFMNLLIERTSLVLGIKPEVTECLFDILNSFCASLESNEGIMTKEQIMTKNEFISFELACFKEISFLKAKVIILSDCASSFFRISEFL